MTMKTNLRPYAVFDIDGTLIRWQLIHAVADALAKRKIIDPKQYQNVLQARQNWKDRLHNNSYADYENSMIRIVDQAIIGIEYRTFQQVCTEIVNRYQDQVYTYTRDLIADLKKQNYLIFAISGSPNEVVKLVADYYGFDDYAGSTYQVIDGKLTSKKHILFGPAKTDNLKKLIERHQATSTGSIAVGDTLGDSHMLEFTERTIAFNPSRELYELALKNKWEIVVERKNVVYKLSDNNHGQYILASTI
jgi:HAD superfamily hydrolase (TIGR01490 family)